MIFQPFSDLKNEWSSHSKPTRRQATADHNMLAFSAPQAQALGLDKPKFYQIFVVTGPFFATIFVCGRATILYAEERRRFAREICLVGTPCWHRQHTKVRRRPDR